MFVRRFGLLALLISVALSGCGGRTALELLDAATGDSPASGGSAASRGGAPSKGGTSSGAAAGIPGAAGAPLGGAAGTGPVGGTGGSDSGGEGGSPLADGGAGAGGEPTAGGAGGTPSTDPPLARHLALGAFHSCVSFDDGTLRCWGHGLHAGHPGWDTIGDDEPANAVADVEIGGFVLQLAASWYHSCAVLNKGTLRCWGSAGSGKLGYGNTEDIGDGETPLSAGYVDVGGSVTDVSTGPGHSCVSLTGGAVRCWGENEYWRLGYGDDALIIGDTEVPADVDPVDVGGFAVQVAAGLAHTCALLNTGKVRCWGSGSSRLGYGNGENVVGDDETPAEAGDVDVGGNVVQIVAGIQHNCALLDTGAVRCWGYAHDGALGYGNTEHIGDDETPAEAGDVDVGGTVTQITGGDYGTCALLDTGTVRCWGSNHEGHLGYGHLEIIGDDETPAEVGDVDVGGVVSKIDMGFWHTCAALQSGSVRCWGRASTGELGYGSISNIGDDEAPASAGDVPTH